MRIVWKSDVEPGLDGSLFCVDLHDSGLITRFFTVIELGESGFLLGGVEEKDLPPAQALCVLSEGQHSAWMLGCAPVIRGTLPEASFPSKQAGPAFFDKGKIRLPDE